MLYMDRLGTAAATCWVYMGHDEILAFKGGRAKSIPPVLQLIEIITKGWLDAECLSIVTHRHVVSEA